MAAEVGFEVFKRDDGTLRVRTSGMGRHGRPEIEVIDVDPLQAQVARELLGRIAARVTRRPVVRGHVMRLGGRVSIELQESEHTPVGFLARALGARDRVVLRVTDAGAATANAALCSTARSQAKHLARAGDATAAARLLHEALEAVGGDDELATRERACALVDLSRVERDPAVALEHLLQGLRLCPAAQRAELDATFDEVSGFRDDDVASQMRRIAAINLGLVAADELPKRICVVPSPIWQRSSDGLRAELGMLTIPGPWLRLYWVGGTRTELESGLIADIAARIFIQSARSVEGTARLVFVTRPSRRTFALPVDAQRSSAAPWDVEPHMFLASAVLAHVARLRVAGLDASEIAAAFGGNPDQHEQQIARDKAQRLRVRLAQWSHDPTHNLN